MFAPICALLPSRLDVTAGEEIASGYVQCRRFHVAMGLGPQGESKVAFGTCQWVLGWPFLVNDIYHILRSLYHIYSVHEENETGIKSRSTTTKPSLDLPGYVDVPLELS